MPTLGRRTIFAGIAVSGSAGVSGCLADGILALRSDNNPDSPDDMHIDLFNPDGKRVLVEDGSLAQFEASPSEAEGARLLIEPEEAYHVVSGKNIDQFVEETNFDESYLLVVSTSGSGEDRTITEIIRSDAGLRLVIEVERDDEIPAEDRLYRFLLRVTDERDEVPKILEVTRAHTEREGIVHFEGGNEWN